MDAAAAGRRSDLEALLQEFRPRLGRMVRLRLDPRLARRVDASDVVQDALVDVSSRLEEYLAQRQVPFFVWVRFLTGQRLAQVHRAHLGAQARDIGREVDARSVAETPEVSSWSLAEAVLASGLTPSQVVAREEDRARLRAALEQLRDIDREILVLRHFEQLDNHEVAAALGLSEAAASARYVRALDRMESLLRAWGERSEGAP